MVIEKEDASNKSELITAILAVFWGTFGFHRFYVGKWISGIVYFLIGRVSFLFNILEYFGVNAFYNLYISILASGGVIVAVIFDLLALKSEAFTDAKNKLLISKATREESSLVLTTKESALITTDAMIFVILFILRMIIKHLIIPEIDKILI